MTEPNDEERRIASIPIHRMRLQVIVDYREWLLDQARDEQKEAQDEGEGAEV